MQHGGRLMTGNAGPSDANPRRRDAEGVILARIAAGGLDGAPRRVHATPDPHQVACPGQ
jgi:hypothetical protein